MVLRNYLCMYCSEVYIRGDLLQTNLIHYRPFNGSHGGSLFTGVRSAAAYRQAVDAATYAEIVTIEARTFIFSEGR